VGFGTGLDVERGPDRVPAAFIFVQGLGALPHLDQRPHEDTRGAFMRGVEGNNAPRRCCSPLGVAAGYSF
jgi:hypothetical protein